MNKGGQGHRLIDIAGKQFGRWSVSEQHRRLEPRPSGFSVTQWKCRCTCGQEKWVSTSTLRGGRSRGCRKCSLPEKGAATAARHGFVKGEPRLSKSQWGKLLKGAKSRGHVVTMDRESVLELLRSQRCRCALTGWAIHLPDRTRGPMRTGTASPDRIDNASGYVPGNVQWLHWTINKMKGSLAETEFIKACVAVTKKAIADGVVDVQVILGETSIPKTSGRLI